MARSIQGTLRLDKVACSKSGSSRLGQDGVAGAVTFHEAGATVLAADEASCMVFETQRAAIEAVAVDCVLPVDQIANWLVQLVRRGQKGCE